MAQASINAINDDPITFLKIAIKEYHSALRVLLANCICVIKQEYYERCLLPIPYIKLA